jgi:hypothetical protein
MKQESPVDYIFGQLPDEYTTTPHGFDVYIIAKAMEREQAQQYAEFAIECDRKGLPILEFNDWIDINTNEKGDKK